MGVRLFRYDPFFLQEIEHVFRDDRVAFGVRMHAVRKVERRDLRHSFEEERQERGVEFAREFRIRRLEFRHVFQPEIAGNLYSYEHGFYVLFFQFRKDGPHVRFHLRYRKPLKPVIRADAKNRDIRKRVREKPVGPFEKSGGGVARNSGVRNRIRVSVFLEQPFELRRVRRFGRKLVSSRERIAHYENGAGFLRTFRRGIRGFFGGLFSA